EKAIEWVALVQGVCYPRGLAVGRGQNDLAVHRLEAPTPGDPFRGQPVEQFGMGRQLAPGAEFLAGLHQTGAETARPEAAHRDAADQRIVRIDEPARQGEPIERLTLWE